MNELDEMFTINKLHESRIAKVWEDNEGCIKLAKREFPHVTPNSKHYGVKYHWFREKMEDMNIEIAHIDTTLQKADIFTKGLPKNEFEPKRKLIMGW